MNQTNQYAISVVIPTIGRQSCLCEALKDLARQQFDLWECIIVTQSDIELEEINRVFDTNNFNLRIFASEQANANMARNIGLLEAKGKLVLFLDDDIRIPNKDFLKIHSDNYRESPELSGVSGQILVSPDFKYRDHRHRLSFKKSVGWLYFPSNFNQPCDVANGGAGNLSLNRQFALEINGFDMQFEKGAFREESDFCLRLARKFGLMKFDPAASIQHLKAESGGCRTGSDEILIHHSIGEWYFIMKSFNKGLISKFQICHHLLHLFRRQIWNENNRWRFSKLYVALKNSHRGYKIAQTKLKEGSKYLDTSNLKDMYKELSLKRTSNC